MSEARFAVGIDLGTTHCALAELELGHEEERSAGAARPAQGERVGETVPIPQVVAPGNVEALPLLPSFLYLPHPEELPEGALTLPWSAEASFTVGEAARALGAKSAQRLVSSAKSWLCHAAVDRRAPILPAGAPDEVPKVSPVEASVRYLTHLKAAWDHAHPDAKLESQLVTLTVPASFDPAARELTAEAARQAGLGHAVLLEEPQAALYSWLDRSAGTWREQVSVGEVLLVVDVGGGTTDLSLIAVREEEGNLVLERVAVGEHILLGGDNMDLALAYHLKGQLEAEGRALDAMQMAALTHAARGAKERLLTHPDEAEAPVVIPGRGSKLIGGTLRASLLRDDLTRLLLEGFFPVVDADARPVARPRAGLTQLGLPYAQDAAITRHLAAFLGRQSGATGEEGAAFARPSAILFNGGVFKSALLEERVLAVVNRWLEASGAPPARKLAGADLDLAVARGAAYYGQVRAGGGIRIRGGSAMAYYVGVESAMPAVPGMPPPLNALCVAPFGLEEGTRAAMPEAELGLVVGEPVRFRFFGSSVRRDDAPGALLERFTPDELTPLSDIEVSLPEGGRRAGEIVTVRLQAGITEVGTLEVEAVERQGEGRWKVELDTREASV
jgi:molecular chaperone DnaK (HSP70)